MSSSSTDASVRHPLAFRVAAVLLGLAFALLACEAVFRLLPVATGAFVMAVNEDNPVFRFHPDQEYVWSVGWNFEAVNHGRTNRQGFFNDQDYDALDPRPLLAVVGDSYVEAVMVPYAQTLHGRLARRLAPRARVYSFAASGAPLSQYLAWVRHARDTYRPRGYAIVVVGNDFDESLAKYKIGPGFHHFVPAASGELELRRFDYRPGGLRRIVRRSAFARYLVFNLHAEATVAELLSRLLPAARAAPPPFVGNTSADAGDARLADSRAAVDAFLEALPGAAGSTPDRVALLVDAIRPQIYEGPASERSVAGSYFAVMRGHLIAEAEARGFEVIDLNPVFRSAFRSAGRRFEFRSDFHWNSAGHAAAAEALAASRLVSGL
jgi:hypothetical protein